MVFSRSARQLASAAFFVAVVIYLISSSTSSSGGFGGAWGSVSPHILAQEADVNLSDKAIVVASLALMNTSWVHDELPDWKPYIYIADDTSAPLHTSMNKGNEANVYLTWIIKHYNSLPATVVFTHHHEIAYHIDNAFQTNAESIRALNIRYVQRQGYVNLRCMDEPGCICAPMRFWDLRDDYFKLAWPTLFPNERMPDMVMGPCCAQFAVSRAQIRARPLSHYIRIHEWLLATPLKTYISGRIMEHSWHIIFGRDSVFCPDENTCYCEQYGLCDDAKDEKQLNWQGKPRGFWPEQYSYLEGHACAKKAPKG